MPFVFNCFLQQSHARLKKKSRGELAGHKFEAKLKWVRFK